MGAVTFSQVQSLPLWASSATADSGVADYWAGYRPGPDAAFGASATLAQTWNDIGGTYLFLATTPASFASFSAALAAWLPTFAPAPPRFLWIANPDDPAFFWQATGWFATGISQSGTTAWTTHGIGLFSLGGYRLSVAAGAALTLDQQEPARAMIAAGAATFFSPGGAFGPSGASAIGFQGSAIGVWTGTLAVPADGLGALGVELRYALRYALDPADPRLVPVSMPVLGTAAAAMSLAAAWDPLHPELRGRTGLSFAASSPVIDCHIVTQRGYASTLTPASPVAPLWPGGLMFCRCPTRLDTTTDPRSCLYSLAPDGAFTFAVVPPAGGTGTGLTDELMLGLSGLESAALAVSGTLILFQAGEPGFALNASPDATLPGTGTDLLTDLVTTAWMTVLPPASGQAGLHYYAQPRQSPLFTGGGSAVMNYQEVPAAALPGWTAGGAVPPVYPVGVYAGVAEASADAARALENAALAPRRRQLITGAPPGIEALEEDGDVLAITPKGLVVTLPPDLSEIKGAIIANLPDSPQPRLAFDRVDRDFEAAIFANQLFFVVSNVTTFLEQASCEPPFALDLDGWRFRLDPVRWRSGEDPTLMVWKYANRSLESLAADTSCWGWQAAAKDQSGSLQPTWKTLNAIIEQARLAAQPGGDPASPYARFYREVVHDPGWNGVLFLNAPVDLSDLPPALRFVAAGLDPARFFAHHVGASVTPFDPTTVPITLKQTSVFGLIDYVDTVDLVPETTVPFQFKTMRLMARFANAHLVDFASTVEISLNRLFAARLIKQESLRGNNLIISGTLQKSGGAPSYAFSLTGENRYKAINTALTGIEITSVRIATLANPSPDRVTTDFALGGKLRFFTPPDFDPFGYGPAAPETEASAGVDGWLTFSQLVLTMDFSMDAPSVQTWTVNETGIGFDLANSNPRPDSLVNCFPVTARAIAASPNLSAPDAPPSGVSPEDMGYLSISAPLDQVPMVPPWYGLVLTLDLGSLGALAGGEGLKAEILAAWMVGASDTDLPIYFGLKLPGTPTRSGSFPLQGVLKLGFKSFIFSTYPQDGKRAYLLKLSRFALSVLGFSFPPGNLDISLFGGPQGRSTGQLGWLAAYTDPNAESDDDDVEALLAAPPAQSRLARRKRLGRLPVGG
ncbi:MAG: hypothetical protein QOD42_710 [Sphingomonadales bacterium]|jgi:hypothetical protein|nr:hypothetical protein [Sphingomonadales bacterium]